MKVLNFLFVVVVTTLLVSTLLFSEEDTWKGPGLKGVAWRIGKVGIGTMEPDAELHVRGIALFEGGNGTFSLYGGVDHVEYNGYLQLLNSVRAANAWGLKAGGVLVSDTYAYANPGKNDLIVKGNVGIGVAKPIRKLEVNGNIWLDDIIETYHDPGHYGRIQLYNGQTGHMTLETYWQSGNSDIILNPDHNVVINRGSVGIGTQSPGAKLDVNGDIAVNGMPIIDSTGKWKGDPTGLKGDPGPQGPRGPQGPPGTSLWTDVRANVPSITTSANVGIGTKPESTYKLQVSGGARIRDYLIIDADPKVYKPGSTLKLRVNGDIKAKGKVFASCGTLTCSDVRYKKDLKPIENALDRIILLRGVSFSWKDDSMGKGQQLGVIGQEVEKVFPEVVSTDSDGYKSVAYSQLVAPLIEAIKELKSENETLKARIEALEKN